MKKLIFCFVNLISISAFSVDDGFYCSDEKKQVIYFREVEGEGVEIFAEPIGNNDTHIALIICEEGVPPISKNKRRFNSMMVIHELIFNKFESRNGNIVTKGINKKNNTCLNYDVKEEKYFIQAKCGKSSN